MFRSAGFIATMAFAGALGCGGRETATAGTSRGGLDAGSGSLDAGGGSLDAGGGLDTGGDSSDAIAPRPCEPTLDAGTAPAGDAEVPVSHRAAAECCPTVRGPGPPTQPYPPESAPCSSDADCDAGPNGRCFPFAGLVGPGGCSYDQCFTDSNCPSGTPCICRSSPSDNSANVCVAGGDCVIDSDCGPGGYCSPSLGGCEESTAYYCHTALDECTNDADCPSVDGGELSAVTVATCAYSPSAQRWACEQLVCLPP